MRTRALRKKHTPVDKSALAFGVDTAWRDRDYLDSMRDAECIVTARCGSDDQSVDPAHLRLGWYGKSTKPHDFWCLPLLHSEHLRQSPEGRYWQEVCNENPRLLYEFIKGYATLRYLKHRLGDAEMSDRQLVAAITEVME